MKRLIKSLLSLCMAVCISVIPLHAFASSQISYEIPFNEIEVTSSQLSDGITVLITRNSDNTYTQSIYTNPADVPVVIDTADGIIDWAKFHLGFKDWTNYSNELYFTVTSDEPLKRITGNAYVKSTSVWGPTYFDEDFDENLNGSSNTGRQLSSGVDTEDDTKVRVGFKNVWLMSISGDYCVFENDSIIVERE